MAVAFQSFERSRQKRHQPLAADPTRRVPQVHQRRLDLGIVALPARAADWVRVFFRRVIQYRNRILAMVPGRGGEFIEDPPFVVPMGLAVPWPKTGNQFMTCCLTHSMPHYVRYS